MAGIVSDRRVIKPDILYRISDFEKQFYLETAIDELSLSRGLIALRWPYD